MNSTHLLLAGALASMAAFSTAAHATCPSPYDTATCDGGSGSNNCTRYSATKVECDFNPADQGVVATFISPTATSFQAYGTDGDGEDFCCEFAVTDGCTFGLITVNIFGTDYGDTLCLLDGLTDVSLECSVATVSADEGDDAIVGSDSAYNSDFLHGQGGADSIESHAGHDYIYGGSGDDHLEGGPGSDHIYGDTGTDRIWGGNDNDFLYGGGDNDQMCGNLGSDYLYGEGGYDELQGNLGTDYNNGGTGTDHCEDQNMSGGCVPWWGADAPCSI